MANRLSVAVLGPPEVQRGPSRLAFTTRKALAILIYLAVERRRHAREELLALFWPEAETSRARASLRTTLTFLRQALADVPGSDSGDILSEADAVEFNPQAQPALDLDVLAAGVEAARGPRSPQAISRLQAAVAIYRGEFLAGFVVREAPGFDDWAAVQREHWHMQLSRLYGRLAGWLGEMGQLERAIETAARWASHDRLNEAAHRQLMILHDAAGNRAAALQAYAACQAVLRSELGVEPSPETRALVEQLRKRGTAATARASAPQRPPVWRAPFAGRAAEHAALVELYEQARAGVPTTAVLLGEPGIGKTRLAQEFQRWAAAVGGVTAMGQAVESGGRPPYQPLAQVLRANATPASLSPVWLSELSRLLPELREQWPELPEPIEDERAAATRLFEALARWLEALARPGPLVITLDDLQWADAATLDVLRFLARRWAGTPTPALLILTARTTSLAADLESWLGGVSRDLPVRRIMLAPLAVEEVSDLVATLAGGEGQNDASLRTFSRWLWSQSEGQPFFVVETLQALRQQGLLTWQPTDEASRLNLVEAEKAAADLGSWVAPGVRDLIAARLAPLSASAAGLLAAGAVLGPRFAYDHVRAVAELADDEALRALDEAQAAQLLQPLAVLATGAPAPQLSFAHDRIRAVVYERAGQARRLVLHRRAYAILLGAGASQSALAYHALQAGQTSAAFTHSLSAGQGALRVFAVADAIELLEQARGLAETATHSATDAAALTELFSQLGRAYQLADRIDQAQAVYEAMRTMAQARGNTAMEITALNRLATLWAQGPSALEPARALLGRAAALAEQSGNALALVETTWNLAQLGIYSFDLPAAFEVGKRALALARTLNGRVPGPQSSELVARCQNVLAYAGLGLGRWEAAAQAAQESASFYQSAGNTAMEADSLGVLANLQHRRGELGQAIGTARMLHARARGIGNTWGQLHASVYLVQALAGSGELGEALTTAETMETLAAGQEAVPWWRVMALAVRGAAERASLLLAEAHAHHAQALALCQAKRLPPEFEAALQAECCADCALLNDWEAAAAAAHQALARAAELLPFGYTRRPVVQALLRSGDARAAEEAARRLEQVAMGNPRYELDSVCCQSLILASLGQAPAAAVSLQQALARAAEQWAPPTELWEPQALLGELQIQAGHGSAARRTFGAAAAGLTRLAAELPDNAWRERFLAANRARQVFEAAKS